MNYFITTGCFLMCSKFGGPRAYRYQNWHAFRDSITDQTASPMWALWHCELSLNSNHDPLKCLYPFQMSFIQILSVGKFFCSLFHFFLSTFYLELNMTLTHLTELNRNELFIFLKPYVNYCWNYRAKKIITTNRNF